MLILQATAEGAVGPAGLGSYAAGVRMESRKLLFRVGEMSGFGCPQKSVRFA